MSVPPRRDDDEELFIGWAPASRSTMKSALSRAFALALVVLGLGALVAASMRSPGDGLWPLRSSQNLIGLLVDGPTPMLLVADSLASDTLGPSAPTPRVVLLSSMGRSGPGANVLSHAGEIVTLSGNLLERDGRQMLEVGAIEVASLAPEIEALLRAVRREPVGAETLRGEIVDAKCYLGRMRPGAGRTHRACAQSCVGGGVPPILVTHGPTERHYALEGEGGRSVRLELLPFVTEPVEITGYTERFADLLIVRIEVDHIRRL